MSEEANNVGTEAEVAATEPQAEETKSEEAKPEVAADAGEDKQVTFAYVREDKEDGKCLRVDASKLHVYLLDVIGFGGASFGHDWPLSIKCDDLSIENVRAVRDAAKGHGFMFQWEETTEEAWSKTA